MFWILLIAFYLIGVARVFREWTSSFGIPDSPMHEKISGSYTKVIGKRYTDLPNILYIIIATYFSATFIFKLLC